MDDILSNELFIIAVGALAFIAIALTGVIAWLLPKVANMVNQEFAESLANTLMLGAKEFVSDVLPRVEATAKETDNKLDDFIVEQVKNALVRDGYIVQQRDDGTPVNIPDDTTDVSNATLEDNTTE